MKALQKSGLHQTQLALIEFSLKAKSVDFSKVLAQIDGMVIVLGKEQVDDDTQKDFCDKDLAKSEAEKASTEEGDTKWSPAKFPEMIKGESERRNHLVQTIQTLNLR